MLVCSYGNKAGYSTGVELTEVQPQCHPALLWLPWCLLLSANPTFTGAMTKSLHSHYGFCCMSRQDHCNFYHMLLTTDQMYFIWAFILVKAGKGTKVSSHCPKICSNIFAFEGSAGFGTPWAVEMCLILGKTHPGNTLSLWRQNTELQKTYGLLAMQQPVTAGLTEAPTPFVLEARMTPEIHLVPEGLSFPYTQKYTQLSNPAAHQCHAERQPKISPSIHSSFA